MDQPASHIDQAPKQPFTTLIGQLDELLSIIYAKQEDKRRTLIQGFLKHELGRTETSPKDDSQVSLRCLFFACQEVIPFLTRRYLFHPQDHMMHEELILYIQDRLMAQNFRRIALYQDNKNARFKTYIQRIIHNLAIDFLRKYSREAEIIDTHIEIDQPENQHLDQRIEHPDEQVFKAEKSLTWIQELLQEKPLDSSTNHSQPIGEVLNLEISERLFLKAIYFGGLSAEQAGALPGLEMNKNQANSLHRRLLERLADVFKQLNIYQDLQQLVVETNGLQKITIGELDVHIAIEQLILLLNTPYSPNQSEKQNAKLNAKPVKSSCQCQVDYQNRAVNAGIYQSYSQLRKRVFQQMLDIRNDAMAGENYLQALENKGNRVKLHLLEDWQEVQSRYRKKIKQFFATQFTD